EDVCDGLIGGTPGLYGLCVAYCEAQDLNEFDKRPPSEKILANYEKKMKEGDPDMPCVKTETACKCWTPAELDRFGSLGSASCSIQSGFFTSISDSGIDGYLNAAVYAVEDDVVACEYADTTGDSPDVRFYEVDAEAASECEAQIIERCDELGL
ncbi:MAG: hypothetical protein ACR2QB_09255, partial [Gammaproteobacteria bacterium]